nr:helix-turn-helix transcriptional regulator [uncultured Anaeromusa sp.]
MASLATRLRELRTKKDIGQKEVGAFLGVSDSSIRKYESGERTPDPDSLTKLAQYFAVTTDYLLGVSDDPRPHNPSTGKEASARETRQLEQLLEMDGLTFKGAPLSEDDRNKIKAALEIAFWDAKEKNKKK